MSMAGRLRRGAMLATGGALLLAACGQEDVAEPQAGENRDASGEVLEGTISDAMIPLDELRSQPPRLKIAPEPGNDPEAAGTSDEVDAAADAQDTTEAETQDAADPSSADDT